MSPGFQKYLEGLTALHSAVAQADGARAAGLPVRRDPIETIHPVVRVHPVTGWKSVYVNHGEAFRLPVSPLLLFISSSVLFILTHLLISLIHLLISLAHISISSLHSAD